ncbi:MAG: endonuclease/exonuclease/phosphatase [Alphaproteobacteria bacterium]
MATLDADEARYGLPERRPDSVILASFNIRKLGTVENKSRGSWSFLRRFADRCDLLAIQEVQDNLAGLQYLHGLLGSDYHMVVSDATGGVPGVRSMKERLAFLYREPHVRRTQIASDIAFERSFVFDQLWANRREVLSAFVSHEKELVLHREKLAAHERGERRSKPDEPPLLLPFFLTFIRSPHLAGFEVPGFGDALPYRFVTVNAHLLYGDKHRQKEDREREFRYLLRWLILRAKETHRGFHEDILLLGDLNLDFEDDEARRAEITEDIKLINSTELAHRDEADVNFPFLTAHPRHGLIRTNARRDQTYDQIGLFMHDPRLPRVPDNDRAGSVDGSYDYGMFDFVRLFVEAFHGRGATLQGLDDESRRDLLSRFEHDVSDHMPIWVRLVKPFAGQGGAL